MPDRIRVLSIDGGGVFAINPAMVFDGVADTIDLELEALLGPGPGRYWCLQTALTEASDDLDDASPENLRALRRKGERLAAERADDLDEAIALLAKGL
ncbi:MAG: hypothetical protein ACR2J6_09130 [Thermoleophilaceae bacterium]